MAYLSAVGLSPHESQFAWRHVALQSAVLLPALLAHLHRLGNATMWQPAQPCGESSVVSANMTPSEQPVQCGKFAAPSHG